MLERKLYRVTLIALCLLLVGTGTAMAEVVYQITSAPTFVISTGRSEVLGSVRITSQSPAATPTVASTIQVLARVRLNGGEVSHVRNREIGPPLRQGISAVPMKWPAREN